jgi:urocanate hydratase
VDIKLKGASDHASNLKEGRNSPATSSRSKRYVNLRRMMKEHAQTELERHNALVLALQQQNDKFQQLKNNIFQQQHDEIRGLLMDLLQQNRNSNQVPPAKQEAIPPLFVQGQAPSKFFHRRNHEESKVQVKVEDPAATTVRSRSARQPPPPLSTPAPAIMPPSFA